VSMNNSLRKGLILYSPALIVIGIEELNRLFGAQFSTTVATDIE